MRNELKSVLAKLETVRINVEKYLAKTENEGGEGK
jgi:hypothetical protein